VRAIVVIVIVVAMVVIVIVIVVVTVTGQLEHQEADAGGDQDAPDDRVLGVLDGRAELQPDRDDHRPEGDRHEHVRDPGQPGQARDPRQRITAGATEHRERDPVVGQDRVTEPDARRRGEQRWSGCAHAVRSCSVGWAAKPSRRCSVCDTASLSSERT
jgi:hypothetical protein